MTSNHTTTMDLPTTSLTERTAHDRVLFELESKRIAAKLIDVPTLPVDIMASLRQRSEPIRLFGENDADVRDRLRLLMGREEVLRMRATGVGGTGDLGGMVVPPPPPPPPPFPMDDGSGGIGSGGTQPEERTSTKYTYASKELITAREDICLFSLSRARARLQRERMRRWGAAKRKRLRALEDEVWEDGVGRMGGATTATTTHKKKGMGGAKQQPHPHPLGDIPRLVPYDDLHIVRDDTNRNDENDEFTDARLRREQVVLELTKLDDSCRILYRTLRNTALEGSQYGDARPLSAICASRPYTDYGIYSRRSPSFYSSSSSSSSSSSPNNETLVATGGWSGGIKLWDGSSPSLDLLAQKATGHEDRIMNIAMRPALGPSSGCGGSGSGGTGTNGDDGGKGALATILATASVDRTCRLWNVRRKSEDVEMETGGDGDGVGTTGGGDSSNGTKTGSKYSLELAATLVGHQARLCSVAFHPSGRYVGTTSFDHTWRLWDVERSSSTDSVISPNNHHHNNSSSTNNGMGTGTELLLQDGHWKEVYGIGFHPDGSLVATGDFGSVVQVWDLRSGKSVCQFLGHAKRVLCTEFSPNGFQLATAGDDGTIKVWDLRRRRRYASLPAHSKLVSQLKFSNDDDGGSGGGVGQNGEYLVSCSFDGTGKVWSTRDFRLLSTLRGHEGKVMGIDVLDGDGGIVTCGYDKTMKIWR